MKLLLDTHVLLWWLSDGPELSKKARSLLASPEHLVFISAASIWELRIKEAIGKITLPDDFESVVDSEPFEKLSITTRHAHALRALPLHHRDPFDRMLVVQALLDDLTFVTHDAHLKRYDIKVDLV